MKPKELYANLVLALQLMVHLFRRLIGRRSPGLKVFLENYREDGIPAMSAEETSLLYEISRCVSCRLCDSLCPSLLHARPEDFMGPAYYPSSTSRLIPDYPYAQLESAACKACPGCEAICPRHVPIRETFSLMRRKVEAITS